MRRADKLAESGLDFMDVGVSGGVWGLAHGYALMIGGKPQVFQRLQPVFRTLAPGEDRGLSHVGPVGAGHFVKMVHNGPLRAAGLLTMALRLPARSPFKSNTA